MKCGRVTLIHCFYSSTDMLGFTMIYRAFDEYICFSAQYTKIIASRTLNRFSMFFQNPHYLSDTFLKSCLKNYFQYISMNVRLNINIITTIFSLMTAFQRIFFKETLCYTTCLIHQHCHLFVDRTADCVLLEIEFALVFLA